MRTVLLFAVVVAALLPAPPPQIVPGASTDVDRAALDAAREVLAARRTKNLVVLRHGRIAYYFTRRWDVGPGESCSLPAKWMDTTGAHLVFSGNDSFSVRRATFDVRR